MRTDKPTDRIHIEGAEVHATSPEGQTATMPLGDLLGRLFPERLDTGSCVLPDGTKAILNGGNHGIWVIEIPPRLYNLKWIATDSPAQFGPGTKYRLARITLPYVIVMACFVHGERGKLTLSQSNEAFFRTEPLRSLDDELLFPALLNCSKFACPDGRPLAWLCSQYLVRANFEKEPDLNLRRRRAIEELLRCLFEAGFNYSSEAHEGSSWFTESRGLDERIATIEAWEAASAKEPLFVLNLPWLKTGLTVRQMAERMFKYHRATRPSAITAAALARLVFNSSGQKNGPA
jgi:hypothetical protein